MNASGIWRGRAAGRLGHFKFINVEVLPENRDTRGGSGGAGQTKLSAASRLSSGSGPASVEELLLRIGLKEYTSVFVLNG